MRLGVVARLLALAGGAHAFGGGEWARGAGRVAPCVGPRLVRHRVVLGGSRMGSRRPFSPAMTALPQEAAGDGAADGGGRAAASARNAPLKLARELWKFTRPHTLIGSALSVPALHLFAAPAGASIAAPALFASCWTALLPALLINIYITGLNQITDVEIDRINKPDLPLASGGLSVRQAQWVVGLCLVGGLALGFQTCSSVALRSTLLLSALIGTAYSTGPRLKRFPLFAALCILTVRGAVVNVGFYAHALETCFHAGGPANIEQLLRLPVTDVKCGLVTAFFAVFGSVIALMKDVPDIAGDSMHNIKSFTVRLGTARVFRASTVLLCALLLGSGGGLLHAATHAPTGAMGFFRAAIGLLSLIASQKVYERGAAVDASVPGQVYEYYMFVWKLFYGAYAALPFAR